jgi:hypothetical protein
VSRTEQSLAVTLRPGKKSSNPSIERTSNSWLRHLSAAAHVKR